MSKIALQGGNVITKNGFVSCSCCVVGCCMYPAQALSDDLHTAEDLPEDLDMFMSDGTNIFVGPTRVSYNGNKTYGQINEGEGPYIALSFVGDEWVTTYNQIDPSFPCLFSALEADNPPSSNVTGVWVFDTFDDIYGVTVTSPEPNYYAPTVERQSLCEWFGAGPPQNQESDVTLYYWDGISLPAPIENPQIGWYITLGEAGTIRRKENPQNSPVGEYNFGNAIIATVSKL